MDSYTCAKCGLERKPEDLELISVYGKGCVICADGCPDASQMVGQVWEG